MAAIQQTIKQVRTVKDLTMSLICEEEPLSESQKSVYKDWETRVTEYNELMKKHKDEEDKYQKAVKAVDARVGVKEAERVPNGPTKFLRAVPSVTTQTSAVTSTKTTNSLLQNSLHTTVSPSNIGHSGVALHNRTAAQNLTLQMNGKQQMTAFNAKRQPTVRMILNPSQQNTVLPGVQSIVPTIRSKTYLVPQGSVQGLSKVVQSGNVTQSNIVSARNGSISQLLQAGGKQLIPYSNTVVQNQHASKGQKRPAEDSASQESKNLKETFDIKLLPKYYGFKKGKPVTTEESSRRFKIKCFHCNETMGSNILYAEHVKKIVESQWPDSSSLSAMVVCPRCFKRFRTPFEMQEHLERSHVKGSLHQCFACDLSFTNNTMLMKHMNMFHSACQMPFCCQICEYRTSAYADIMEHFSSKHEGFKALMCPYCLKMLRCSKTFLGHCQKHIQMAMRSQGGSFPCKNCKLSFLSSAERSEHAEKDHKKFNFTYRDGVPKFVRDTLKSFEIMASAGITSPTKKIKSAPEVKYVFTQQALLNKHLACMECGQLFQNFGNHFTRILNCERCIYTTFCPRSLSNHMILFHKMGKVPPTLGTVSKKQNQDGTIALTCKACNYQTKAPTHMAHHRAKKCPQRTAMEWMSYLFVPMQKKTDSSSSKVVDVIVLDSDED